MAESNEVGSLSDAVVDSVANTNFKALGEQHAFWANAIASQYVTTRGRLDILAEKSLAKSLEHMDVTTPLEGAAEGKVAYPGHDLGAQIAALTQAVSAALAAGQMNSKTAGNTPPVTP